MTRMKKELMRRGIVFNSPEYIQRIEEDCCRHVITITDKVIVTVYYSSVLDPIFHFFDRFTLEEIGQQEVYKETQFFAYEKRNPWSAFMNI